MDRKTCLRRFSFTNFEVGKSKIILFEEFQVEHIYRVVLSHLKWKMNAFFVQFWLNFCSEYAVLSANGLLLNLHTPAND